MRIRNICSAKHSVAACSLSDTSRLAYVFFLSNATGLAVPRRGRDFNDGLTYFDYVFAAVSRLCSLTDIPIVVLVTRSLSNGHRVLLDAIASSVTTREIVPAYETSSRRFHTPRQYHLHTFGKLEVFNPRWMDGIAKVVCMDTDTFALRAPDELFCLDARFAAGKRKYALASGFNSGVFFARPSSKTYDALLAMVTRASVHNRSFALGEQTILNEYFSSSNGHCFGAEYNCGGFGPPLTGAASTKCELEKAEEDTLFGSRSVLQVKLSQRKVAERLPKVSALWRSYLPRDHTPAVPWTSQRHT